MKDEETSSVAAVSGDLSDQAADVFVRRRHDDWTAADQAQLDARLAREPDYVRAIHSVGESWDALQPHAISPEMLALREQAIARARRSGERRWRMPRVVGGRNQYLAAAAAAVVVLILAIQVSPFGFRPGVLETGVGELRLVELEDRSKVALDAGTRIRVRFSEDVRSIELLQGQAQFSVAADPQRPFKVRAGNRLIIALGTVFNVEYVGGEVRVTTLEGRVAVLPTEAGAAFSDAARVRKPAPANRSAIELIAGEAVHAASDGALNRAREGDLAAAMAWREGKLIFRGTPLAEAVERLNRYSHRKLEIADRELAALSINGVFAAGDNWAFAEAVQLSSPVGIEQPNDEVIRLTRR